MSTTMLAPEPVLRRPRPAGEHIRIPDREGLIYLLDQAAELEHGAICTYLFAAFSLKRGMDEGLDAQQAAAVTGWRGTILEIALQEMMHLATVSNLLTAVGGAPHCTRPALPHRLPYAPENELSLTRFSERTLERFLYIERPEGMDISGLAGDFGVRPPASAAPPAWLLMPAPQPFSSVGGLCRAIEHGLDRLMRHHGAHAVFVGDPAHQVTPDEFRMPDLVAVTDLDTAHRAAERVVAEGERQRGHWRSGHFGRFAEMLGRYRELKRDDPVFEPARQVLANPLTALPLDASDPRDLHLLCEAPAAPVGDLCSAAYEVMLQVLARLFDRGEESEAELATLAGLAVGIVSGVVSPLGDLLTRLPAGSLYPDRRAGPSFAADAVTVSPHKRAAWTVLHERLLELAAAAGRLAAHGHGTAELSRIASTLHGFAQQLAQ